MLVKLTLELPNALEALIRSNPKAICNAVEHSVSKAIARQLNVAASFDTNDIRLTTETSTPKPTRL